MGNKKTMKKLYFRYPCCSSIKLIKYLRENNIRVELLDTSEISKRDIVYLLKHTDNGYKDFLKDREYIAEEPEIKFNLLEHLTFDEAVVYLLRNLEMFKTPIVFDKEKDFVSFHEAILRQY